MLILNKYTPNKFILILSLIFFIHHVNAEEYANYNECLSKETKKNVDLDLKKLNSIKTFCEDLFQFSLPLP